jgi:nuclear factor erythroid 2
MAESMARSAISGGYATDFLYNPTSYLKEEVGPLRGAADYPYAYAAAYQEAATAAAGLVHPYTHHMAVAAGSSRVGDLGGLVGGGGGRSRDRKRKNASASASSVDGAGGGPIVGGHQGLTRDERKALTLSLPIAVQEIINLPMDEFNDLLSKHDLTEEQLTLCRDIRRRGKNKVCLI